jgi:hypothetical protein
MSVSATTQGATPPPSSGCSGAGLSWNCVAGASVSQVQSAINNASNGATITFANGNYTWNSPISLNNKNGITLICATVRGCNISFTGDAILMDYTPQPVTALVRISGFVFTGRPNNAAIWIAGSSDNDITKLRIDNNTFKDLPMSYFGILLGATSQTSDIYGVIDHNIFTGPNSFMPVKSLAGGTTWKTGLAGTERNIFIEDNTVTIANNTDYLGFTDSWMAGGIVVRYNNSNNSRITSHGAAHGGPANTEWYGNIIHSPSTNNYRNMHHQ